VSHHGPRDRYGEMLAVRAPVAVCVTRFVASTTPPCVTCQSNISPGPGQIVLIGATIGAD